MARPVLALVLTVVLAALGAGAGVAGGQVTRVHVVRIKDIAYRPARLVVRRGDRVRWRWLDDPAPHTVTSVGRRRFRGASARRTGTYSVRFTRRGTYRYVCDVHPFMHGMVVVR